MAVELVVEKIEIEQSTPIKPIKTSVPIPVITIEKKDNQDNKIKRIKRKRTSEFISKNKDIFSRFIPSSMQFGSFGMPIKENKTIGIPQNFGLSSGLSGFTEFDFSPPIS